MSALEPTLSLEARLQLYRELQRIRSFEEELVEGYQAGAMGGFLFISSGQEAIAVAVRSLFGPHDHSISGHRGVGHAVAAGMSQRSIMAEFCGRATGCCEGRAGAGGLSSPEHHFWGTTAVVASQTPVAAGLAFHLKQNQLQGVVVCFLGEGGVNQGVYHESLNLAGLLELPVIYIIENNGYSCGSPVARTTAYKGSLARRADGYGIAYDTMDGWDVEDLRAKLQPWFERERTESLPAVLEISTYRFHGLTIADASQKKYRTPEEIEWHMQHRDPLEIMKERLLQEGMLTEEYVSQIKAQTISEAKDATEFALASPFLREDQILDHVYE